MKKPATLADFYIKSRQQLAAVMAAMRAVASFVTFGLVFFFIMRLSAI